MFVLGMAMFVGGYTLLYYGVELWQHFRVTKQTSVVPSLSYLFGLSGLQPSAGNTSGLSVPTLPFDESSSGTTGGANPTTPVNPSTGTGGGVQSV